MRGSDREVNSLINKIKAGKRIEVGNGYHVVGLGGGRKKSHSSGG